MPPHRNALANSATRCGPHGQHILPPPLPFRPCYSLDPNCLNYVFLSPALSQAVPTANPNTSASCPDWPSPGSFSSRKRTSTSTTVICRLQGCNKPYNRIPDLLRHMTTGTHREALVSLSPPRVRAVLAASGPQEKYINKALKMLETDYICGCGVVFDRIDTLKRHFKLMGHGPPTTVPLPGATFPNFLSPPDSDKCPLAPGLDRWTQPQLGTFDYPHLSRILDNTILSQPWVPLSNPPEWPGECSQQPGFG